MCVCVCVCVCVCIFQNGLSAGVDNLFIQGAKLHENFPRRIHRRFHIQRHLPPSLVRLKGERVNETHCHTCARVRMRMCVRQHICVYLKGDGVDEAHGRLEAEVNKLVGCLLGAWAAATNTRRQSFFCAGMYFSCTTLLALLKMAIRFLSQPTVHVHTLTQTYMSLD